jgi:hypothetical protein
VHPSGKGDNWVATIVERTEGHYEVQKTSYGEAYVWCPEYVVVECDCGERLTLTSSMMATCRCGADHALLIREEFGSRRPSDEAPHPWDAEYQEWRKRQDEYVRAETHDWLEWRIVE